MNDTYKESCKILADSVVRLSAELEKPNLLISEYTSLKRKVNDLSTASRRTYIDSFSSVNPTDLLSEWIQNKTYCVFFIKCHKQFYRLSLTVLWKECSFYDILLQSSLYNLDSNLKHDLQTSSTNPTTSINKLQWITKNIADSIFQTVPDAFLIKRHHLRTFKIHMCNHPNANALKVLFDIILLHEEPQTQHVITRHPAWCFHNTTKICDVFHAKCHTSINCPFFLKCIKLDSGAYIVEHDKGN